MQTGRWEYAQRTNARAVIVIVAITETDEVVFIEQYRDPIGKRCVELPAGLVGDKLGEEDEDLSEAVRRELIEETGFTADQITFLATGSSSAGLTDEVAHVFLAQGLRQVDEGGGVDGELIQLHLVPREQIDCWLAQRQQEGLDIAMSLYGALWLANQYARGSQSLLRRER
jgi:ADP-ribose pyrophosphatase